MALLSLSECLLSSSSSLSCVLHSHREKENRESLYSGLLLDSMFLHRGAMDLLLLLLRAADLASRSVLMKLLRSLEGAGLGSSGQLTGGARTRSRTNPD